MCVCVCVRSATQSCLTLLQPCGLEHARPFALGIFQARLLEWGATSYSNRSSQPKDRTHVSWVSCTGSRSLYTNAPLEALHTYTHLKQQLSINRRTSFQSRYISIPRVQSTLSEEADDEELIAFKHTEFMTLFESLSDVYHTVAYFQLAHLLGVINLPILLKVDHCLAVYSSFPLETRRTYV